MTRPRLLIAAVLVAAMTLFGVGVYRTLGHFQRLDELTAASSDPLSTKASVTLPGTLYLSQGGDLFSLHGSDFKRVLAHDSGGAWIQPSAVGNGDLIVVNRHAASSDLVEVAVDGSRTTLLRGAAAKRSDGTLDNNHWYFYPRVNPDGTTLWLSYDGPKQGYLVDLAIWSLPLGTSPASATPSGSRGAVIPAIARRWTDPNSYTGGDDDPLPLAGGGVIFTRYSIAGDFKVHSQLWYVASPRDPGHALTDAAADCSSAALSPDSTRLAMVCTGGDQVARLVVAPMRATVGAASSASAPSGSRSATAGTAPSLGQSRVLVDGTLVAQPVWAPDGSGLTYLAPADTGANFQLWWLEGAAGASPKAPAKVTTSLGFDATSRAVWVRG